MLATWVSGWLNCREYWMNACTSPSDSAPGGDPQRADDRDQHVVEVADEHHRRLDRAGDELGPEAGLVQLLVVLGERVASACSRWPNTLTSECPVYISSMWPLSLPVVDHCLTNCGWARLPIRATSETDTGTVTSAISASSGEIQNIMASTPTMVSSEVTIWLSVCCRDWARLSMSLVTRLRISPRGWRSK